jgi:hypothetical protein
MAGKTHNLPFELVRSLGKLVAGVMRQISGHPSDAQVIADAILAGLLRLAEVGDVFAQAALTRAEADLIRAYAELVGAQARFLEAKAVYLRAHTEMARWEAKVHSDSSTVELVRTLWGLATYTDDFETLIGRPLAQILSPDISPVRS